MLSVNRICLFFAAGLGLGYIPFAPGTWGTLLGVAIFFAIADVNPVFYFTTVLIFIIISIWISGRAAFYLGEKDPSRVVIDEIVGYLVTMAFHSPSIVGMFVGFILFRFFDILKPFPVSWFDKNVHGGTGIVLDDVMAGVYANLTLVLIAYFSGKFGLSIFAI